MKVRKIEIPNMLLDCKNFHCFLKNFSKSKWKYKTRLKKTLKKKPRKEYIIRKKGVKKTLTSNQMKVTKVGMQATLCILPPSLHHNIRFCL